MLEPLAEGAEDVQMVTVMEHGKHGSSFSHDPVEHLKVRLVTPSGIIRRRAPEVEDAEGTPEKGIDGITDLDHDELSGS